MNSRSCSVEQCTKLVWAKGYCNTHYSKVKRTGTLEITRFSRHKLIEQGLSYCSVCKDNKSIDDFYKDADNHFGISSKCKPCCKQKVKEYRTNQGKEIVQHYYLKKLFGITLEEYNSLVEKQNNVCAICSSKETSPRKKRLAVDHNHLTEFVRGLLCNKCNTILGLAGDNEFILIRAIEYLIKHK